ncbi:MAG: class I SAM-dependent methyltransferase [Caldilineaceae bacterium]|nr:class I SAM-dependent methyltransferase [Caldilineaceae bacterium]
MQWALEFYEKQNLWSGVYEEEVAASHREKVLLIEELAGPGTKRILELGAGGGQNAAACADVGHTIVAVELVPRLAEHAQMLATAQPQRKMTVINANFFDISLEGRFDLICYWDGFGIGTDADQRRLLLRMATWLEPNGSVLMDIGTPWYAASVDGRGWAVGEGERRYSFDADGCRWEDTWWPKGHPERSVMQTTRCYSPADLRMLLEGTGLQLQRVKPGGTVDWEARKWLPSVPLKQAMSYVAQLGLAEIATG